MASRPLWAWPPALLRLGGCDAAALVTVGSGMAIGAITAVRYVSVQVKVKLRLDDSLDTYAVHGVGGTAGALLTGVFANAELISSHPAGQVLAEQGRGALGLGQLQAVLVAYGLAAAIGTLLIAGDLRGLGVQFRVTEQAENLGGRRRTRGRGLRRARRFPAAELSTGSSTPGLQCIPGLLLSCFRRWA